MEPKQKKKTLSTVLERSSRRDGRDRAGRKVRRRAEDTACRRRAHRSFCRSRRKSLQTYHRPARACRSGRTVFPLRQADGDLKVDDTLRKESADGAHDDEKGHALPDRICKSFQRRRSKRADHGGTAHRTALSEACERILRTLCEGDNRRRSG